MGVVRRCDNCNEGRSPNGDCQQKGSIGIGSEGAIIVEAFGTETLRSKQDGDDGMNERDGMHVPVESVSVWERWA